MEIQNRVPTSDVNVIQLRSGGNYNYALVDDPIGNHDGDATYCYINGITEPFYTQRQFPISDLYVAWTPSEGSYLYETINEYPEEDYDYNYTDSAGTDEFTMGSFNIPINRVIESVKIYVRAQQLSGSNSDKFYVRLGNMLQYLPVNEYWETTCWGLNINPFTNEPWTPEEINSLHTNYTFGYGVDSPETTYYVSQLYIEVSSFDPQDLYGFLSFNIPQGSLINYVKVYALVRSVDTGHAGYVNLAIQVGGHVYISGAHSFETSYVEEANLWYDNPKTGNTWTVDGVNGEGVNALQYFGDVMSRFYDGECRCTQIYIEVSYLPSEEGPTNEELMRHMKWFHSGVNKGCYLGSREEPV